MRNLFLLLFSIFTMNLLFVGTACKKSSHSTLPEENLKISTDAESFAVTPGPDYSFNINIQSAMPESGVQILYYVSGESDNQDYPQGPPIYTSNKSTRINLVNLPRQKVCICTIRVSSRSTTSNTVTTSFKVAYK